MKKYLINIKSTIVNTFNFKNKTKRQEYWTYFISIYIIGFIISMLFGIYSGYQIRHNQAPLRGAYYTSIYGNYYLILFIPVISATVRRIRDAGYSPWLSLVPLLNLYLCLKPSAKE